MEVEKYLKRINYQGSCVPDLQNLQMLIRAHLETVPFENLDFVGNGRELSLDLLELYQKIVENRRGGVCFELNGLFGWLLKQLGYECYFVGVRVQWHFPVIRPLSHQGIIVEAEGKRCYCDVGFGGPGPKGILDLESSEVQDIEHEEFRVIKEKGGGYCGPGYGNILTYRIQRMEKGGWQDILVFDDVPMHPDDFRILCHYYTNSSQSRFMDERVINLCQPQGSLALTGNIFTSRKKGQEPERKELSESEILPVLESRFGIRLMNEEQSAPGTRM